MRAFLEEFYERRSEVRRYIAIVVHTESTLSDVNRRKFDSDINTFRAGAILILYNAIEASARLGIEAIYDELASTRPKFGSLRETIRKRVIRDFKNNASADVHNRLQNIAIDLVIESFQADKLFSGNVDAREIRKKSDEYGFDISSEYQKTGNGSSLLTIKSNRNDLAHGWKSFSQVGRDFTSNDLKKIQRLSMNYMESVLLHIDRYIEESHYLDEVISA